MGRDRKRLRRWLSLAASLFVCCAARANEPAFDLARLEALLARSPASHEPVDSIAELLPLLPRAMRENFTFVYESRSPYRDSVSRALPRVVMFTADARLVLSFTGDPDRPGADILEAAAFDDEAAAFAFRAYLLPAAQRRPFRPSPEAADCARCHGADPRPIFDAYPLWPGFYGAVLDTFPGDARGRQEEASFRAFLSGAAKAPPYSALIFPKGSAVSPYLDPARHPAKGVELEPTLLPLLPNTRLGMALGELNFKRIGRKLAAAPHFAATAEGALAALLGCRGAAEPSAAAVGAVATALAAEDADRRARLGRKAGEPAPEIERMQELHFVHELALLDDVAARAGADRADWSMALAPGAHAFFDGLLSGDVAGRSVYVEESLIPEILGRLAEAKPALKRYLAIDWMLGDSGLPYGDRVDVAKARGACPLLR